MSQFTINGFTEDLNTNIEIIFFAAEFLGCPVWVKKWDSPQGAASHSVSTWGDCAAQCSSLPTCAGWIFDPADGKSVLTLF